MSDALTFVEAEARQLDGVEDIVVDRVLLVAGEVLANAVEHGGSNPHIVLRVEVVGSGSGVELAIRESSDPVRPREYEQARLPHDVLATEGRGLFLVRSLTDDIQLDGAQGVRFRFSPRDPS